MDGDKAKHRRAREQCIPLLECSVRWGRVRAAAMCTPSPSYPWGGAATTGPSLSVHAAAMLCEYSARQPGTHPLCARPHPPPSPPTHLPHRLVAIFWGTRGSPLIPYASPKSRRRTFEQQILLFKCSPLPRGGDSRCGGVVLDPLVSPDGWSRAFEQQLCCWNARLCLGAAIRDARGSYLIPSYPRGRAEDVYMRTYRQVPHRVSLRIPRESAHTRA